MHKTITARALLIVFAIGLMSLVNASANAPNLSPMSGYEKRLRQVAEAKRSFQLPNALVL